MRYMDGAIDYMSDEIVIYRKMMAGWGPAWAPVRFSLPAPYVLLSTMLFFLLCTFCCQFYD